VQPVGERVVGRLHLGIGDDAGVTVQRPLDAVLGGEGVHPRPVPRGDRHEAGAGEAGGSDDGGHGDAGGAEDADPEGFHGSSWRAFLNGCACRPAPDRPIMDRSGVLAPP
jgi:hypothetical protein